MSASFKRDRRLIEFARQMRHDPSPAERILWRELRRKQLSEFRFRRQHPIEPFIADFVCVVSKLVIELDGDMHAFQAEYDEMRERVLSKQGFTILRFLNHQVFDELPWVLETIYDACVRGRERNLNVLHQAVELQMS